MKNRTYFKQPLINITKPLQFSLVPYKQHNIKRHLALVLNLSIIGYFTESVFYYLTEFWLFIKLFVVTSLIKFYTLADSLDYYMSTIWNSFKHKINILFTVIVKSKVDLIKSKISKVISKYFIDSENALFPFYGLFILIFISLIIIIASYATAAATTSEYVNILENDLNDINDIYTESYKENQDLYNVIAELEAENEQLELEYADLLNDNQDLQNELHKVNLSAASLSSSTIRTLIKSCAIKYGVDPYLALAISRHETGNWTSSLCKYSNNFGGMRGASGWLEYSSAIKGIDSFCKLLQAYANKGMGSIDSMAYTYCPDGTSEWKATVRQFYNEEKNRG